MSLADSVESGFDDIVDAVEFIADPPALNGLRFEYPIFPRDSNWSLSSYAPLWKLHGFFDVDLDYSGANGQQFSYLCGNANGVSPGATWGIDECIKIPGGNQYQGAAYFSGATDTWEVSGNGEWYVRWVSIEGVAQRRNNIPYDEMPTVVSVSATPASGTSKGTIVIQYPTPVFADAPTYGRIEIFKRSTINEMLDFNLSFQHIPPMSTTGTLFGFQVESGIAKTINVCLAEVINPALEDTFEMVTDAVIDAGLTVIDFITQFVWKDVTRDFLLKWIVRIISYGLRVVIGMPSYFIGKFVLDRVIPGIDALNLRTNVNAVLASVGIQPIPSAEADPSDVKTWFETALHDLSVARQGMNGVSTEIPIFELMSIVGQVFTVLQESDPNGD